jgi:hypothetical protein
MKQLHVEVVVLDDKNPLAHGRILVFLQALDLRRFIAPTFFRF